MLNILNLAARDYLALCDGNLANLRQGTPDNCRHDKTGKPVTSVADQQTRWPAVLQHEGSGKAVARFPLALQMVATRYLGPRAERKSTS